MMYHQYRPGYVEVISGCMFAGKTEELIRRIKVLEFAKKKVLVFKPAIDNRYSETKVVSHAGSEVDSIVIREAKEMSMIQLMSLRLTRFSSLMKIL